MPKKGRRSQVAFFQLPNKNDDVKPKLKPFRFQTPQ